MPASPDSRLQKYLTQAKAKGVASNELQEDPYAGRQENLYYLSELVKAVCFQPDKLRLASQHAKQTLQYLTMLKSVKKPSDEEIDQIRAKSKLVCPQSPRYKGKLTVVFDLDETLVHCNNTVEEPHDVLVPITLPTGEQVEAGVNVRPFCKEVLRQLQGHCELIAFTAGHSCYASRILDSLEEGRPIFQHRLYREHCYFAPEGFYIKDLRILGRDLSRTVLVDNAVYSYYFQQDNGIPIIPYYKGSNDYELRHLTDYLARLQKSADVRETNRRLLKLEQFGQFSDPADLVHELFP